MLGAGLFPTVARADFIVSFWELATRVEDFHSGEAQSEALYTVQNPLELTQDVEIRPSFATTNYDIFWDKTQACFHIDASHAALDVPPSGLFSRSAGSIMIEPSVDTVLTVSGFYNYALPPDQFFARLTATVRDMDTNELIWGQSPDADSFGGSFVSGTLNVDTPASGVLLIGGHTHRLRYEFLLRTFGGGTNAIGTGDGEIQWQLTVVPESHSLFLLLFAAAFVARRRHRARL